MTRLLAVAVSFALLDAVWAGDVKSVPEIKADVNPAKQTSTPLTAPVPADPKASVPDLGRIPLVVVPEAQVPAANAAPGALLQPVSQPKAEPQAGPPSVDNEVSAGRIQFDQAQTITATSPGLETGAGAATTIHVSGLTLGPRSSDGAPSARGPPGVGGDGATAEALFAQVLDRAVARGRLTPELRKELLDAAYRDPLTGLYNRLYLDAHVADLSRRYPSLATFKLDSLKEINDSYDHETGNKFMKAMAAVGERVVGPDGVVVRRSPTGFAVFLDAPIWDARLSAEALRLAVSRKIGDPSVILGHTVTASAPGGTISVGVAALESGAPAAQSYREAYAKAEGARQLAKEQGGGDRVAYDDDDSKLMDRRTLEEAVSTLKRRQKDAAARRLEDVDKEDLSTLMQEHDSTAPKPAQVAELLEKLKDPAVRHMAFSVVYRDRLSGLLNRRYLFDHIDALLNGYTSYMALDLDKFGDLNAAIGEDKADLVLAELGALLAEGARRQDALPLHLSGEEFVVLGGQRQLDPKALGEALRVKVRDELGRRVADKYGIVDPATSRPFEITVSIGVAPIKHEGGAADQKLALVNAMAESLLQRAKSNGRDRVEVGAEGLTALLSRVVRVDETVRGVVDGLMKPAARPAPGSAFLDNSFKTRGEVVRALKFNPASEPGTLLSDPNKGGSETLLVSPPGLEKRVVKISDQEVISNETLLRGIVESFEMFNSRLASPKSVA
ncbi:MAG: diguanylate cyclase [Elusimicrobia bacterium]|nr:diguanylate cyclase [Elusimicrobiota bacterium]